MEVIRVGVDLAKNVFQVHGVDAGERPVWEGRLKRASWLQEVVKRVEPGAEVGMEACAGAQA
jgi:transposase